MKKAKIFENNSDRLIDAFDIKKGKESKNHEFVDPQYEFKVTYVKGAKNNGAPHFRLYMSHQDYLKLTPERKTRYDILMGLNHFAESKWHRDWEDLVSPFAGIEKYIKNPNTKKYKRADAYYEEGETIIEFQHSYTSQDFKEKNDFYFDLKINTIWLFDLTRLNVKENGDYVEILEDNARGFFRVSEEEKNLSEYSVFVQVKNGLIYKVNSLERKEINNELQSTIRYFKKAEVLTQEQFVKGIKNKLDCFYAKKNSNNLKSIFELWNDTYHERRKHITVRDTRTQEVIRIFKDNDTGRISENFRDNCIGYLLCFFDEKNKIYKTHMAVAGSFRSLEKAKASLPIWELISVG